MSLIFEALQELEGEHAAMDSPPASATVEFLRQAKLRATLKLEAALKGPSDEDLRMQAESEPRPRTVEWPQPASNASRASLPGPLDDAPEPSTAMTYAAETAQPPLTGVKRFVAALSTVLPLVERILPLFDGVTGSAAPNLAAPQGPASPASPQSQTADVARVEDSIAALKNQQRQLRYQFAEQDASLKRVEDQVGTVREATDRATREQQELVDELKGVGNKVNLLALIALGLVGVSVVIDIALCLHVFNIRP